MNKKEYDGSWDTDTRIKMKAGYAAHYLESLLEIDELPQQGRENIQTFLGQLEEIRRAGAKEMGMHCPGDAYQHSLVETHGELPCGHLGVLFEPDGDADEVVHQMVAGRIEGSCSECGTELVEFPQEELPPEYEVKDGVD